METDANITIVDNGFEDVFKLIQEASKLTKNNRLLSLLNQALNRLESIASFHNGCFNKIKTLESENAALHSQISLAPTFPHIEYQCTATGEDGSVTAVTVPQNVYLRLHAASLGDASDRDQQELPIGIVQIQPSLTLEVQTDENPASPQMANSRRSQFEQEAQSVLSVIQSGASIPAQVPLLAMEQNQLSLMKARNNDSGNRKLQEKKRGQDPLDHFDPEDLKMEALSDQLTPCRERFGEEKLLQMMIKIRKGSYKPFFENNLLERIAETDQNKGAIFACLDPQCLAQQIRFNVPYTAQRHVLSKHMCDWKPFKCPVPDCKIRSYIKNAIKFHYKLVHSGEEKRYICAEPNCGFKTHKPGRFRIHMDVHNGIYRYFCKFEGCGEKFRDKSQLQEHEYTHKGMIYACPLCNRAFKKRKAYISHIKRHEKPVKCPMKDCHFASDAGRAVVVHLINDHNEDPSCKSDIVMDFTKNYPGKFLPPDICSFCKRAFSSRKTLRDHELTHKEERNFICSTCHKSFKTIGAIRKHEKTHLPREQRAAYPCHQCGITFMRRSHLRSHMTETLTHGGPGRKANILRKARTAERRLKRKIQKKEAIAATLLQRKIEAQEHE